MESKILHLTLKKRWFDMILSGEKKEEYRELKPYWISRLVDEILSCHKDKFGAFYYKCGYWIMGTPVSYDLVRFKNGYSKNSPEITLEINDIDVWTGKYEWGAEPSVPYFRIKLGKIIETKNIENGK